MKHSTEQDELAKLIRDHEADLKSDPAHAKRVVVRRKRGHVTLESHHVETDAPTSRLQQKRLRDAIPSGTWWGRVIAFGKNLIPTEISMLLPEPRDHRTTAERFNEYCEWRDRVTLLTTQLNDVPPCNTVQEFQELERRGGAQRWSALGSPGLDGLRLATQERSWEDDLADVFAERELARKESELRFIDKEAKGPAPSAHRAISFHGMPKELSPTILAGLDKEITLGGGGCKGGQTPKRAAELARLSLEDPEKFHKARRQKNASKERRKAKRE